MARGNTKDIRRPEDWFPPARSPGTATVPGVDDTVAAAIADLIPIAESDVTNLVSDLAAKLDDSQAGAFGLTLLGSANLVASKTSLAYVKGDVGLGNVDNTSDANKPVSTAQQTALDLKLDDTQAGVFGLTLLGSALLADAKISLAYVKADVGLGSVDNTADAAKNVLSATKLTTARNINGVSFDGTGDITINAVDSTARVPATRTISTTAPITGGGDLSADRTIAISAASGAAAGSMSAADKTKLDAISGTNTGDQTSIVGITGSLAEFNAALTGADFATGGGTATGANSGDQDLSVLQPLDADLTAIAALTTTAFGRGFLDLADAAAGRTKLSLGTAALSASGDFQPVDGDLTSIAALTTTAFGRGFLDLADAAAGRTKLALGTAALSASGDFQPIDSDLTSIAALTTTAFGRGFLDLADAAAGRTKLALGTAALSASGDFQPIDSDLTAIAALTTTAYGRALLALADQAALTALIAVATTSLSGAMSAADKTKSDATLSAVKYDAAGAALGAGIADYFTSTISLEANSIYEIICHAYFLKTTAGTVLFQWTFSSAPTVVTSRYQSTPVTGFTTSVITGAEVFAEATIEAATNCIHAASASLTTAVRHSFIFRVRVRTSGATTVQLRCTESAGTVTPQPGSYMRAIKII